MARWTPVIIQGGKTDPATATGAGLSQAFAYAGLAGDDEMFDFTAIYKAIDDNKPAAPSSGNEMPCCEIFTDEFGEQHFRFF